MGMIYEFAKVHLPKLDGTCKCTTLVPAKHQRTICSFSTPTNTPFWRIFSLFIISIIIQIIGCVFILKRSVALCVIVLFFPVHNVKDIRLNHLSVDFKQFCFHILVSSLH